MSQLGNVYIRQILTDDMPNIKINIHNRSIAPRKESLQLWNIPQEEKKAILKFLDELALGKVNKGYKISESRQSKYLDVLRAPLEFFKKSTLKITLKDVENFERALCTGQIKSNKELTYSHATQVDMRRALQVYLRWRLGATKSNKLTDWFDTKEVVRTPDYLKEADILRLFKACKSAEERFLVAVLFDSGARAEEFHNIRYEDIELPKEKDNYVKLTLKEEYSKTKGRVISLYWKYSLEAVADFIKQREREGIRADEQVFNNRYENSRKFLQRLGKKILSRSIHYHLFRHSSATYYAPKLNRQQLCIRYGWAFSSRMPDTYISRSGMINSEIDEKMTQTELGDLKAQLERQMQENKIRKEAEKLLAEKFISMVEVLKKNKQASKDIAKEDLDQLRQMFG